MVPIGTTEKLANIGPPLGKATLLRFLIISRELPEGLKIGSQLNRSTESEILDGSGVPELEAARAYEELQRTHDWLGNTSVILRLLSRDPVPVRSVLDIGCAHGALLQQIRRKLGTQVVGFDLRPAPANVHFAILEGNAVTDSLPCADVALAICMAHHLSESDLIRLIRNVSHSCRRFILLDLVRHWLPLALFRIFIHPLLGSLNAKDGITSLHRSFTPCELRRIVGTALEGSTAKVKYSVAPFYIRQIVDISW
jgi:2-polyprenyl-3-methyl-5-hydroxy-6-metoxy-1,4-benzoquinol methylase